MKPYRRGVVAVIINDQGLIFAGERSDKSGIWQLPQGGIDPGESAEQTLFRELEEEIGCNDIEIIARAEQQITYDFPESLQVAIAKDFRGQVQDWFLVKFKPTAKPDLSRSDGEFKDLAWKSAAELLAEIVDWKKDAYRQGFAYFNLG